MSRHYLVFLNGPVGPSLLDRLRRLDPGEPFLHVVMPPMRDHDLARQELKAATDELRAAGFEVHADHGTVEAMRDQGWPLEGLVLAVPPGHPTAWVDVAVADVVDREFPLLAAA